MFSDFKNKKAIIGMVHVGALPGTPNNKLPVKALVEKALAESRIYEDEGFDAILIENMHDRPYLNRNVGPEIVATLTRICSEIKNVIKIPAGLQILAGANKDALAVANACDFDFVRTEGFVFGHLADEGMMNSDAGELLRYRKMIGAENVKIFTDIKKKHSSHVITEDISLVETAKAAEYFLSDGLIVTGASTGMETNLEDVKAVKENSRLPVIVGSGVNTDNVIILWDYADAFIIGSSVKYDGRWENDLDRERIRNFVNEVKKLNR